MRQRIEVNTVFAITPPVNKTAQHLEIELVLEDGSVINTNHMFEYRGNPVFTDIRPRDHLIRGGTQVIVRGDNLDSVAEPRITLTAVVTRFYNETESVSTKTETDSEPCKLPEAHANGSQILCRLPAVSLPDELTEHEQTNESREINSTEGPGVATVVSADGRTRADIYVGLKLDGFKRYQNISSVDPSIKFQFSLPPTIFCEPFVEFDPNELTVISIKGQHLQRGIRLVDIDTRLGVAVCVPVSLSDNHVDCRPPANKSDKNSNDTFCHGDTLSMRVMISCAHYQCSCVHYLLQENAALAVGLLVGLAQLLVVVVVAAIIVLLHRRYRKRKSSAKVKDVVPPKDLQHHNSNKLMFDDPKESLELQDLDNTENTRENAQRGEVLPESNGPETTVAKTEDNPYSKELPDCHEYSETDEYCKELPGDYQASAEFADRDNERNASGDALLYGEQQQQQRV